MTFHHKHPASPDYKSSVEFLKMFRPDDVWVITAIAPDTGRIITRSFAPSEADRLLDFLAAIGNERNIYFHVNPTIHPLSRKARISDIRAVRWLHVDSDPRPQEDPAEERARMVKRLTSHSQPPTVIVDSGGGIQAFWRLQEEVEINGDEAKAADVKRITEQLASEFDGDVCSSVDHLMRLPGTINWPNEKKRARGRLPRLATMLQYEPARSYPLAAFKKGSPAAVSEIGFKLDSTSLKHSKLVGIDELPDSVPGWCKVLIIHGQDPDSPNKYASRSEALFAVVCELARCEINPDMMYGIIVNPEHAISSSVLDKSDPGRYAARQVERAITRAVDPDLFEMNEKHAVISVYGNKCIVISAKKGTLDECTEGFDTQTFENFRNRYLGTKKIYLENGDPKEKTLGNWWLSHPRRRQYDRVVFSPDGHNLRPNEFNLWRGFAIEPRQGSWELFRRHIVEVLAAGDPDGARYIVQWAAWTVQNPGRPAEAALCFGGGRGTGKGTFGKVLKQIFGMHGLHVSSMEAISGKFNAPLRRTSLLFVDEAIWKGDPQSEGNLKRLITEPTLYIEAKGYDAEECPNRLHVVIASNEGRFVPAGLDERRFTVFTVSESKKGDRAHFNALYAELDNGGAAAFLYDMLGLDLNGWHPREVYKTNALVDQKIRNLSPVHQYYLSLLHTGVLPNTLPHLPDVAMSSGVEGQEGLFDHARRTVSELRQCQPQEITADLKKFGAVSYSTGNKRGWRFPPLSQARAEQEKLLPGIQWDHPDVIDWGGSNVRKGEPF